MCRGLEEVAINLGASSDFQGLMEESEISWDLETDSDSNLGAGTGRNVAIDDDDDDICIIADCFNT